MKINLHSLAYPVRALGPGSRAVIWVAGCTRQCPGCMSPEMQSVKSGRFVSADLLLKKLSNIDLNLEGLTISGGEPFNQWPALKDFLIVLKKLKPDWNVILYSGYTLTEINTFLTGPEYLSPWVDVLIDGPYIDHIPSLHPLAGSGNQKIHYLTEPGKRMKDLIEQYPDNSFDYCLGPDGTGVLAGVGRPDKRSGVYRIFGIANDIINHSK